MEKILKEILDNTVDNVLMIKIGLHAKAFILKRVEAGQYFDSADSNKSLSTHSYSTKPMPIPYGLFIRKFGKKLTRQNGNRVFRSSTGHTMVLIKGGYNKYREMSGKTFGHVTEHWTARMMRNLGIVRSSEKKSTLGFTSEDERLKASYQHIGAGRNKVVHAFMDLTNKEINKLGDLAEKLIIEKFT